jgi:hypothetical protein
MAKYDLQNIFALENISGKGFQAKMIFFYVGPFETLG